jgi:hypothetical protein
MENQPVRIAKRRIDGEWRGHWAAVLTGRFAVRSGINGTDIYAARLACESWLGGVLRHYS